MENKKLAIGQKKKIALVAHDHKKNYLLEWAKYNKDLLSQHELYATGTTGKLLEQEIDIEAIFKNHDYRKYIASYGLSRKRSSVTGYTNAIR